MLHAIPFFFRSWTISHSLKNSAVWLRNGRSQSQDLGPWRMKISIPKYMSFWLLWNEAVWTVHYVRRQIIAVKPCRRPEIRYFCMHYANAACNLHALYELWIHSFILYFLFLLPSFKFMRSDENGSTYSDFYFASFVIVFSDCQCLDRDQGFPPLVIRNTCIILSISDVNICDQITVFSERLTLSSLRSYNCK